MEASPTSPSYVVFKKIPGIISCKAFYLFIFLKQHVSGPLSPDPRAARSLVSCVFPEIPVSAWAPVDKCLFLFSQEALLPLLSWRACETVPVIIFSGDSY